MSGPLTLQSVTVATDVAVTMATDVAVATDFADRQAR